MATRFDGILIDENDWLPAIAHRTDEAYLARNCLPRLAFSMWTSVEGAETPQVVTMCLQRMAAAHPGWSIIVGKPMALMHALELKLGGRPTSAVHKSDKARLSDEVGAIIVAKHGGVWFDASIIAVRVDHRTHSFTHSLPL